MVLRTKYNVNMDVVFTDWTSMYFETSPNSVIKFGYSRDHRSDHRSMWDCRWIVIPVCRSD